MTTPLPNVHSLYKNVCKLVCSQEAEFFSLSRSKKIFVNVESGERDWLSIGVEFLIKN